MEQVPCRRCGEPVAAHASACPHCGQPEPSRPPRSRRRTGAVALVVAALLGLGLLTYRYATAEPPSDRVQCVGDAGVLEQDVDEVCPPD